jgi:heptosyltransferase-3
VIHVSRIGDTLLATPALRAIAQAHPGAEITVLAHPKRGEILRQLPFIAGVGGISKQRAPWLGRLSGRHYELGFVFGFDKPLVRYALRVCDRVVAFRQGDPAIDARLAPAVAVPAFQSEHSVDQLLRLPQALGIPAAGKRLAYRVSDGEAAAARARLAASSVAAASPLVGLQVASFPTKAYRDWPVEHFAELCARIVARWPQAGFLIFGGSEERQRTDWLAARLGERALLLAGRLSLRETAAMMSLSDLYVGVDTGPTHLMSAFDIPLLGLYHGFSRSALIAPLDHPCLYAIDHPRAGPDCPTEAPMSEIGVDTVFKQVERALAEHPPRSRA